MNVYVFAMLFMVCSLAKSMPGDSEPDVESAKRAAAVAAAAWSEDEGDDGKPPEAKRADLQSDKDRCREQIESFLSQEIDIKNDLRLEYPETPNGIPSHLRAIYLDAKAMALTTFIYMQRFSEIEAYDSGQGPELYLRLERVFKPIPSSLLPILPPLEAKLTKVKEQDIHVLSARIDGIYGSFESGLTRPSTPFLNAISFTEGAHKTCYENNKIGPRLDRFLSFIESYLEQHETIDDSEKKAQSQERLKRLYEILHSFEDACVDRSLSALDDAEQTMQFMMDSLLLSPAKDLSEEQKNQKRYKLLYYAIENYKKYQLMAFLHKKFGNNPELREVYLVNLLKVQKSLGLQGMVKELFYLARFKEPFQKPFAEIMINIIDEMTADGFLGFVSGIQEIPDESRQWLYQKTILEELNFDDTFYAKLDDWRTNHALYIPRIEKEGTSGIYHKAFYQCATEGREPMEAYESLMRQFVREQAKKDLIAMGFALDTPYYQESFTAPELYGDFYPSTS
ncbi:MAG: hypothetical protein CMM87_01115 [Rickettsiales bacterium]|nr:hypothetical protein [Rickettsiales bacterium]